MGIEVGDVIICLIYLMGGLIIYGVVLINHLIAKMEEVREQRYYTYKTTNSKKEQKRIYRQFIEIARTEVGGI